MAESVLTLFRRTALRLTNQPCFHFKRGDRWEVLTWVDAEERVRRWSLGLAAFDWKPGTPIGLLSATRVEWTLLDLAILASRNITVPLYPTLSAEQAVYILKDSGAPLLIVEHWTQLERLQPKLADWSGQVICIEEAPKGGISLAALQERGKERPVNRYDENLRQILPTDIATIVYTSGTTGPPKGAILTHRNLLAEVQGLCEVFHFSPGDIGLMCLPLAHVIARAMQFFALVQGCQTAFAENMEQLPQNLREVRPHFMAAVPRLLEKSHEKIEQRLAGQPKRLRQLFNAAHRLGARVSELRQKRMRPSWGSRFLFQLASLTLFRAVRHGFGGRLSWIISGGAPLSKEVAKFFHAVGILVLEGYGLTETFAAVTINRPDDFRFGTVGKPLEGMRLKIAPDGEVVVKGDTVFAGYRGLKQATEEAFDEEGWFRTGDVGEFTKDGFLKITDRKKDIIVTSTGKNVAPQVIEARLQQSPYIQQAFVYGDRRKFLSALVTLQWEAVARFAGQQGIGARDPAALAQEEAVRALIQSEIDRCNRELSNFETIKKFAIVPANFSIEAGELTPTLKVKRKVIAEKYKNVLDQFYV